MHMYLRHGRWVTFCQANMDDWMVHDLRVGTEPELQVLFVSTVLSASLIFCMRHCEVYK